MKWHMPLFALLSLTFLLSGCSMTYCTLSVETRADPRAVILAVGESFTPTMKFYACERDPVPISGPFQWTSQKPHVATVGRTTGTITGRAVGQTYVFVRGEAVFDEVAVTVLAH